MTYNIDFLRVAEIEAEESVEYYENERSGLGTKFRISLERAIDRVRLNPLGYPVIHGTNVRRALVSGFPYSVIFTIHKETVLIYSIFHSSRNPKVWSGRIG